MSSMMTSSHGKCKYNAVGRECSCQLWDPSEENAFLCDCCEHHMSFHEPLHPVSSGFGTCVKKIDDGGTLHEDGCQEYFPTCAPKSRKCAGCSCHRSYHTPIKAATRELVGPSNVDIQQEDSWRSGSSTDIKLPSSKSLKLDLAISSTNVDNDGQVVGCGDGKRCEIDVLDIQSTTIGDMSLQCKGNGEDDNNTYRPHLEPKHKVFLSHSGAQKDFVEQLCIDLERCDRYPFFDKRRTSLPVGLKFPELLFTAIQQCEVGVVILSEEFFTKTKWPMLELVKMVGVSKELEANIKIVPVFCHISREECRKQETQKRWICKWEEWAKVDKTIDIDEWKMALKIFGSTTSLSMKDGEVQLRKEVVDAVCDLVLPESRWDDLEVKGRDRLCKVILDKMTSKDSKANVSLLGLYGMGGMGKTTICKVLCNKLYKEFQGQVCHCEMKSATEVELFRTVLKTLTNTKHNLLDEMILDKCRDQLKRCIVSQRVFLAIDNVDEESSNQAMEYLKAMHFLGKGSIVVVTARSLDQLKALNICEANCLRMPELEQMEAKMLFKYYATSIGNVKEELSEEIITRCVKVCCFKKGDGRSYHYLPLALKVLGNALREQLGCSNFDLKLLDANLSKIEEYDEVLETMKRVFSVLRISYDTLSHEDQKLFMDVVLLRLPQIYSREHRLASSFRPNLIEWLCVIEGERKHNTVKKKLNTLKKKSLLEEVGDGSSDVVVHDLWREFCIAETKAGTLANQRWIYAGMECIELVKKIPQGGCWANVERMVFMGKEGVQKFHGLHLDYFLNVKVLKVEGPVTVDDPVVLELGKLVHLSHLDFMHDNWHREGCVMKYRLWNKKVKVCGLELLSNIAYLRWEGMPAEERYAEDIAGLVNMQFLILPHSRGSKLPDMSNLTSLRVASFYGSSSVETIVGLSSKLSSLRSLNLSECEKLESCPGLDGLIGLESLDLSHCFKLEVLPNLRKLINLKELYLSGCRSLRECLVYGLHYLRILDLSLCEQLQSLQSLSDLVSLEYLSAYECSELAELPDVRKLTKLRELRINGCPVKRVSGFEGLSALQILKASFALLDLNKLLLSLRKASIDGCSGLELTGVPEHAMLESLDVHECKEVDLQLDLMYMKRLQTLNFSKGKMKVVCMANGYALQKLSLSNCKLLEVLNLSSLPRLEELSVFYCKALKRLTCREPLVALKRFNLEECMSLEAVPDLSNSPNLWELVLNKCELLTSISSDRPFCALTKLEVRECERVKTVDLCYFPHLERLDLGHCKNLTCLNNSGPHLVALKRLNLEGCMSLEALLDLSNAPNLWKLVLNKCESLTLITNDGPLRALMKLEARECKGLKTVDLSYFPHLKRLDLGHCKSLTCLNNSGPHLIALKRLNLEGCMSLEALPDLSNSPDLWEMVLNKCELLTTIASNRPLCALTKLEVRECLGVKTVDLCYFPHLERLDLGHCKNLTCLNNSGPHLVALKRLNLEGCMSLEALLDLSNSPNLWKLVLNKCASLTMITSDGPLHALAKLEARECEGVKTVDLCYFPHLERLDLGHCKNLTCLNNSGPHLVALKRLNLEGCMSLEALPDLSNSPNLWELVLNKCESLTAISSNRPFCALTKLEVRECEGMKTVDLSYFPHLRMLDLHDCKRLTCLNNNAPHVIALERLNLEGCMSLEALPDLSNSPNLWELVLSKCELLTTISSNRPLHALTKLEARECEGVKTVDLCYFPHLETLDLGHCKNLTCLNNSGPHLVALKRLNLEGCMSLEALPDLSNSPNLWKLVLNKCELLTSITTNGPLRALTKLEARECKGVKTMDLSYFPHLKRLDLAHYKSLTCLNNSGPHLVALKRLNLEGCMSLEALPDLSNAPNLWKLILNKCESLTSILSNRPFTALTKLEARECKRVKTVDLCYFPHVERLDLGHCKNLTCLNNSGPHLVALKRLNLEGCMSLEALLDLSNSPNLWELVLNKCESLTMISSNRPLRALTKLEARECEGVKMVDLCYFPHLETLDLGHCKNLTCLNNSGPHLVALKRLNLEGCMSLEALLDLSNFPNLWKLILNKCESLTLITSDGPLRALTKLKARECEGVKTVDLSYFPHLETLDLGHCKNLTCLNDSGPHLIALKRLNLEGCMSLEALPDLSNSPNLWELVLNKCESLTSITSDGPLCALKKLDIRNCGGVKTLMDLSYLPHLETLYLGQCKSLTCLNSAVPLVSLEKLHLEGCIRLEALPDLSNFPSLTSLNLYMCESLSTLTSSEPLLGLDSLDVRGCRSMRALPDQIRCRSVRSGDVQSLNTSLSSDHRDVDY